MAVIPICFMRIQNLYIRMRVKVYNYIQQYYKTHVKLMAVINQSPQHKEYSRHWR